MTIRNLDALLKPGAIALVGASVDAASVGGVLARNLVNSGFDGPVMPVNPHHAHVGGVVAYPTVADLPLTPDLGIIATPPDAVPEIIAALGKRGARAAIVISAGFGETGSREGKALEKATLSAAKPFLLRVVGPNCLGVMVPAIALNASFAHLTPKRGRLAFVTQSGAVVASVIDWAADRGIGFSHLVSLGDMIDVDFGDMLDYLANDPDTRAILLYIETVKHPRKFMSAARAAARMKPVIAVKAGRYAESARAAASHTGALAGADAVYDAVFRRAGILRVYSLYELFDAAAILALVDPPTGDRLGIVSNGGGMGVLATDALLDQGGRLAALSDQTIEALDAVLPPTWSHGNPIDLVGDATEERYAAALDVLIGSKDLDAVLVINCPTAMVSNAGAAEAVAAAAGRRKHFPILTSWVGAASMDEARRRFAAKRIPSYETPEQAVRGFMYLVNHRRRQDNLMETPPSVPEEFSPDTDRAKDIVARARDEKRAWLTEPEAKEILAAYGIPTVHTHAAATPEEAASAAADVGGSVALKIVSPDIVHKSDVGGVILDLAGPASVFEAAKAMESAVRVKQPDARLWGFSVQPMVHRPGAYELIVGAHEDKNFGPVILFGHGGTAAEIVDDTALGLPPLNLNLANEMISRTRIARLLAGHRNLPRVNLEAIALTLMKLAQLIIDLGEIAEVDINPLLADSFGVTALDARIRVQRPPKSPADRLVIRPYPSELEEPIRIDGVPELILRPIRPEDEPALQNAFSKLTPEEIRLRFLVPIKVMSHVMAARFTQLDYDREMALILAAPGIPGKAEIFGVIRISADPDNERAEYAIIVRHELAGRGLGTMMMTRMLDYARRKGIKEIYGDVLSENHTMLRICKEFGFSRRTNPDDPGLVHVTLDLAKTVKKIPATSNGAVR